MIIKTLAIQNIRSYKNHEINFPEGITLFEGDIGSGKTTILMAIEFALFGLGSQKSAALLRTGESEALVRLLFDVNGVEYEVQRSLKKKGKTIQQIEGYVKKNGVTHHLAPSEIKGEILEILNFNESPDPKAQSHIYRYAVFTPQEEMKTILTNKPDLRLQTLRKAFRIEDYKTAHDNAEEIKKRIDSKSKEYKGSSSDLEIKKELLENKKMEIQKNMTELESLKIDQRKFEQQLDEFKNRKNDIEEKSKELSKVKGEKPRLEAQIKTINKHINDWRDEIEKSRRKINVLRDKIGELQNIRKPVEKTEEELENELERLEAERDELVKKQGSVNAKIQEYQSVQIKEICPTCDRPADPSEFAGKIEVKQAELKEITNKIHECDANISTKNENIIELLKYNEAQEVIKRYTEQLTDDDKNIKENSSKVESYEDDKTELERRLKDAILELVKLEEVSKELEILDKKTQIAENTYNESSEKVATKKGAIEYEEKQVIIDLKEISLKEEDRKRCQLLNENQIWLQDYFIPTLDNIEKHVLMTINQEFNQLFQRWFSLLIEDHTKEAWIDEEFTPIVAQDGYEQELAYLSGGEKTSVALAYRLSLNTLVQKISTSMKSNILILDEPTDGFSKEQLSKIQDILKELNCQQIIIVSHEKELESFADQVFKISKRNGASTIST